MTERLVQHERVIEGFLDQIWLEKVDDNSAAGPALPSGWLRHDRIFAD